MNSKPIITVCFKQGLKVMNRETAVEFYKGVFHCILIPIGETGYYIRVEPGQLFGLLSEEDIRTGRATSIPNVHDPDGRLAFHYRKVINKYLKDREKGWR